MGWVFFLRTNKIQLTFPTRLWLLFYWGRGTGAGLKPEVGDSEGKRPLSFLKPSLVSR